MPINFTTLISQTQSILSGLNGQQKVRLNVTRPIARLSKVFITLDKDVMGETSGIYVGRKSWNDFYSPMQPYAGGADNQFNENGEFEAQLQLGPKLYPEYPIRSHAEAFYTLRKCGFENFDIDAHDFRTWKFVWATEMEKILTLSGLE